MNKARVFVIAWGATNSFILASNLLFFRLHHIGDASLFFLAFLGAQTWFFGGLLGALNWAIYSLLANSHKPGKTRSSTALWLLRAGFGLTGFFSISELNGVFSNRSIWQVILVGVLVSATSVLVNRVPPGTKES